MSITFVKPYLVEGRIQIPVSKYLPAYKESLKALRRSIQVPGFRHGHVPIEYVRLRYGKETLEKVILNEFFEQILSLLGESRMIGFPFYKREPEEFVTEPPYADYQYDFQVLVRPTEPLKTQGPIPPHYKYESRPTDLELFKRYLRMRLGKKESIPQLPPEIPPDKDLQVELDCFITPKEAIAFSWVSFMELFPYSYLAQRAIGEEFDLPPSHLMPYVEAIRAVLPSFSPLAVEKTTLRARSASLITRATDEEMQEAFHVPELTEELWNALFEREVRRLLTEFNEATYQNSLLHAAGIEIPTQLGQLNYLFYLQQLQNESRPPINYKDYIRALGWRIFMESHIAHVPDLEVSDETLEIEVWNQFQTRLEKTEEGKALLASITETDDQRQAILQSLLEENREGLRRSMQYERFENWLHATYGSRPEKPLPLQTILLTGL